MATRTKFIRAIQSHRDELGISDFPSYTESIYKRWFQQLQRADESMRKSEHSFIKMTMPDIRQNELPSPNCFKKYEGKTKRLDFLPKNIMDFMFDPNNASHWLHYTAKIAGRTINIHIVHYESSAIKIKNDHHKSSRSSSSSSSSESESEEPESPNINFESNSEHGSITKGIDPFWIRKYRSHVYKMFAWFHFLNPYIKDCDCSKELNVYLYFTPFKKVLPNNRSTTIGALHANTGFTTSCTANLSNNGGKTHTEIVIYRYEEFFKVLIHESMHNLDLDFGHEAPNASFKTIFPGIQDEIILSETYVETWARILNVAFYCYYDIFGSSGTYHKYKLAVQRCLYAERAFSIYQAVKVLDHMTLSLKDIMSKDSQTLSTVSAKYSEDTNVFAYYVLTGIVMLNVDLFLKWCNDVNKHNLICANNGKAGSDALRIFIEMLVTSPDTRSTIIRAIETMEQIKKSSPYSSSSRMTLWS